MTSCTEQSLLSFPFFSAEEQAEKILKDNPFLGKKIALSANIPEEDVQGLLVELMFYLQLNAAVEERLTPSILVDCAWHEFILFTRYYSAFCRQHFGRYIHHHPGGTEVENRSCFRKTHYWYRRLLSREPEVRFWGHVLIEVADASDCGPCG